MDIIQLKKLNNYKKFLVLLMLMYSKKKCVAHYFSCHVYEGEHWTKDHLTENNYVDLSVLGLFSQYPWTYIANFG